MNFLVIRCVCELLMQQQVLQEPGKMDNLKLMYHRIYPSSPSPTPSLSYLRVTPHSLDLSHAPDPPPCPRSLPPDKVLMSYCPSLLSWSLSDACSRVDYNSPFSRTVGDLALHCDAPTYVALES